MKKVVVSFLGKDGPGIVHAVANLLTGAECNISEVSQTILRNEFAAIFIADMPECCTVESLQQALEKGLAAERIDLNVTARIHDSQEWDAEDPQSFVVSVDGSDQPGIVAAISGVLAQFNINIANMKAVIPAKEPEERALVVYEVLVPASVELPALRDALSAKADEFSLRVSIQHRDIFEATHRV